MRFLYKNIFYSGLMAIFFGILCDFAIIKKESLKSYL